MSTSGLSIGTHTLYIKADDNNTNVETDEIDFNDTATSEIYTPTLHAALPIFTPTSSSVVQGDTFSYSYVIKNEGTGSAVSGRSGIYLDQQSTKLSGGDGYDLIGSISGGGTVNDSNSFSTSGLSKIGRALCRERE